MNGQPESGLERKVSMFKAKLLLVPLALLFAIVFISCAPVPPDDGIERVIINDVWFDVEVPRTQYAKQQGLTGRPYLEADKGMLYLAEGPEAGPFWMKGMRFPLDFIWIGNDCHVVDLHPYAPVPLPDTPDDWITTYRSYPRAAFTLEVNAGDIDRYDIRIGDRVEFNNIRGYC